MNIQKIPFGYTVCFPKAKKLREINQELIEKIGMQGLRFIGNPEAELKKIAFTGHIYPDAFIPQHFNEDGSWIDTCKIFSQRNSIADIR